MSCGGVADFSYPTSKLRRGRVQGDGNISPTITTTSGICRVMDMEQLRLEWEYPEDNFMNEPIENQIQGDKVEDFLYKDYGIFKLTPRECLRLQGVTDNDIDKMSEINSSTRLYMQAGNSITVTVLMAIFSQLNIKGVKPWNDMSQEERETLINQTVRSKDA